MKYQQISGQHAKYAKTRDIYTVRGGKVFYNGQEVDIPLDQLEEVELHVIKRLGESINGVKKGQLYLGRELPLGGWAVFDRHGERIAWSLTGPSGWGYFEVVQE